MKKLKLAMTRMLDSKASWNKRRVFIHSSLLQTGQQYILFFGDSMDYGIIIIYRVLL
jgi:hypothetical protein